MDSRCANLGEPVLHDLEGRAVAPFFLGFGVFGVFLVHVTFHSLAARCCDRYVAVLDEQRK